MASILLEPVSATLEQRRVLVVSPFQTWSDKIAARMMAGTVRWTARLDPADAAAVDVLVCDIAATRGVHALLELLRSKPSAAVIVVGVTDATISADLVNSGAAGCTDRSNLSELLALIDRKPAAESTPGNLGKLDNPPAIPVAGERIVAIRDLTTARKVEQELKDRECRMRVLAQAAFDGIVVERDGVIVECNQAFWEMFGTGEKCLIGRRLQSLFHNDVCDSIIGLHPGQSFRVADVSMVTRDDSLLSVEICAGVIGNHERVIAIRDLSESRRAQRTVEETEFRYRDLVDNTHDLICTHDLNGRILTVNEAASRLLAIPVQELIGSSIRELLLPARRDASAQYMRQLLTNGFATGTTRVVGRDGQHHVWEFRSTLERQAAGETIVRGFARDVTDREEAVAGLRRSEALFRSILDTTSDLVAILDAAGVIRYHSPSFERLLGFGDSDINGRELISFAHPTHSSRVRDTMGRQLVDPQAAQIVEVDMRKSDGTYRSFEIAMKNLVRDGNVDSIVVSARDITERQLLEAQLAQARRLNSLGRLAATVAHEFNNVLMGMQPFAELLQRNGLPPAAHVKSAQHIANSIQRGKRVALDILRFTQPAAPELKALDLAAWWTAMLPEVQAQTGSHITFTSSFPEGIHLHADAAQLSQVFANLISNARDAMPKRGNLSVSARLPREGERFSFGVVSDPSQYVQISVRDDGTGIPQDLIDQIFEPLVTTKENGGTGLGLAVTHQIVTRHAGYIFVESEVGKGAAFHVFLPRATGTASANAPADTQFPAAIRNVLIVEDEAAIIEGLTLLLAGEGVTVNAVQTGGAAEEAVRIHQPDAVVVDLGLPDMDGSDVAMRLRVEHPELPIVFATGHGDREATGSEHLSRFLRKPFEIADLLSAFSELEAERGRTKEISS